MHDIYLGEFGVRETVDELAKEMAGLVEAVDEEQLMADRRLLGKVDKVLASKVGLDPQAFASLKKEHLQNQKMYQNLFDAIEDELITKGDMKLQL